MQWCYNTKLFWGELISNEVQIFNSFLAPAFTSLPPAGLWVRELVEDNQTCTEKISDISRKKRF